MTHCHDLFYITVKHHQNIPNGIQVIERIRKCLWTDIRTDRWRTDARLMAISPEPFGWGIKRRKKNPPGLDYVFTSFSTVLWEVIMNGCEPWNLVYSWKDFHLLSGSLSYQGTFNPLYSPGTTVFLIKACIFQHNCIPALPHPFQGSTSVMAHCYCHVLSAIYRKNSKI